MRSHLGFESILDNTLKKKKLPADVVQQKDGRGDVIIRDLHRNKLVTPMASVK